MVGVVGGNVPVACRLDVRFGAGVEVLVSGAVKKPGERSDYPVYLPS